MVLDDGTTDTDGAETVPDSENRRRSFFDFYGRLLLEVRGEGGRSTDQFRALYEPFEVDRPTREPDVVVERTTADSATERVLGGETDHYGWTGEAFVVRDGPEFMRASQDWRHIAVSPDWEPYYATYPIEFHLRRRLIEEREALVHASGVRYGGETTLFPAWRGAGKTNTLLSMLRAGADFLADDRLWVGADGVARGYPLAVNLHPRNARSFPGVEIRHDDLETRLRASADQRLQKRFGADHSVVGKAVSFLSSQFVGASGRTFSPIGTLYPAADFVGTAPVDNVVLLDTSLHADRVRVDPISTAAMLAAVTAISHYEWDTRLGEYFRAYDALVPAADMRSELRRVVAAEEAVFRDLFDTVGTYRATIPRSTNWSEQGLDRQVVEVVETLGARSRETSRTNLR